MAGTRVGIIGAGWIARVHVRVLSGFDDVRVVGIASRNPDSAGPLAESAGARVYPDYRSMLDEAELDAVFVCVPPYAAGEPALAVVDRGIALFAEKPLGVNEELPARIAKSIHEKRVVSCVGYQWRYLEVVDRARELLEAHPAHLVVGSWLGETPGAAWWIRKDQSGGQIVEQATHIFDLARYLVGEMEPTSAAGHRVPRPAFPESDILDVTETSVSFASGAVGSFSTTSLLAGPHRVELETVSDGMALTLQVLDHRLVVRLGTETSTVAPPSEFETPYRLQNRAFVDAAQGKPNRIRSTYDDALLTHHVTLAASRLANAAGSA
ncbi:MAG: Gfo/Idh/MocA family oxidoreductase [Candidatus Limnocylindrales bacterium]|jgi:predicted dehydrogenase